MADGVISTEFTLYLSRNCITCKFLCFVCVLLYTEQIFYHDYLDLYGFKEEWVIQNSRSKIEDVSSLVVILVEFFAK